MEDTRKFKLVGAGTSDSQEKIQRPTLTFMQDAWRRLKKNKLALVALWFLAFMLVFAALSTAFVSKEDANTFNSNKVTTYRNLPPKISDHLPFWNGTIKYSGSNKKTEIIEGQTLNVDAVSGASVTSNGVLDGVARAIRLAGGNPDTLKKRPKAPSALDLRQARHKLTGSPETLA